MKPFLFFLISPLALGAPLSWEELQDLAKNNSALQSSVKTLEASKANVKQSYSGFLPQVSLSASQNHDRRAPENSAATKTKTNTQSASASINLFKGFSTVANIKSANALRNESESDQILKSADVRYDLRLAYFNYHVQQERIRLFEKVLKRTEQNEKLVSIKYNAGTEAKWNVQLNRAELERAKFNFNSAKRDLELAKDELARVLNLDQLPERTISAPDDSVLQIGEPAWNEIMPQHPRTLKYTHETDRTNADKISARSGFLPSLDLSYTRSKTKVEENPRIDDRSWTITASWNIFNGFSDMHKVQKANAAHEAAELTKEYTGRNLESELKSKFSALKNNRERLPVLRALREATEARLQTVSTQYRTGLKTYIDWEQAEKQLVEAEQLEVSARKEALFALADFERSLGKGLNEK